MLKSSKTLEDWLSWLDNYKDSVDKIDLTNILAVAQELHLDQTNCPVITVTGTNGKGSTVAVLESIAITANLEVGSYTSPHIFSFTERIKINGIPITEKECIDGLQFIYNNLPKNLSLTYFEFATLATLKIFKKYNLDLMVLEVGLGGRLDAVNIINNNVSVITSVSLDHCQQLGNTIESIAREKAGIIKKNSTIVCGTNNGFNIIKNIANHNNANIKHINHDFKVEEFEHHWSYNSNHRNINNLPVTSFPVQNAACAITAIDSLNFNISEQQIKLAINNVKILGRFQIYKENNCEIIFDVAHNPEAAKWLVKKLINRPISGKTLAIINICKDKDWVEIIKPFLDFVDCWYTVDIENSRLFTADALAINIKTYTNKPVISCYSMSVAIENCLNNSSSTDRIVIFGSFFTVSAALKILSNNSCG